MKGWNSPNPARGRREARGPTSRPTLCPATGPDAGDLRADPQNAAVMDADVMLSLIKPRASAANEQTALALAGAIKMPAGLIAVKAHTSPFTGQGVTVAVLDTGLDDSHPAFTGKTIIKRDFTGEGANATDVSDKDGHGTHCAGTVCGTTVDGIRVGVAPGVTSSASERCWARRAARSKCS